MAVFSAEKVQEIVEEKEAEYKKLEEEYWFLKEEYEELKEECQDLKKENNTLKRDKTTLMKANATVLGFYREDCGKMDDLQKLNNKLVKSNKEANRDFFILAIAYFATLSLMLYLFISYGVVMMRVNELVRRCRTDQSAIIHYEGNFIEGTVFEIVEDPKYRLDRIGDMIVTYISSYNSDLILRAVKV